MLCSSKKRTVNQSIIEKITCQAVCASLLSLAIQSLFSIPLTLFTLLALILILGISVDYVIFFVETKIVTNENPQKAPTIMCANKAP